MKNHVMSLGYTNEINEIAKDHLGALLAFYADSFEEGMRAGQRNALIYIGLGITVAALGSCAAVLAYLEHKEHKEQP